MSLIQHLIRSRPAMQLLMGLCVGVAVSVLLSPAIDDYYCQYFTTTAEPVIPDFTATKATDKQNAKTRPRFASTELGVREKLFFGVLSTMDTLETRAVAVNRTLGTVLPKLTFFVTTAGAHPSATPPLMPIVAFVDDQMSHEGTFFRAVRYVAERYINVYDWFFFAPDDVYVHAAGIVNFVAHISVAGNQLIGKPIESNYEKVATCDFRAGVLISQPVMTAVIQNLPWCKQNAIHSLSDAAIAQLCLAHAALLLNISCTDHLNEMVFSHYYNTSLNIASDLKSVGEKLREMLTVGQMKDSTDIYMLHRYICESEMTTTRNKLQQIDAELRRIKPLTPDGNSSHQWPLGIDSPTQPITRYDVITWSYFTDTHIYLENGVSNYQELKGIDKEDLMDIVRTAVSQLSRHDNVQYVYRRIVNGYRRFDAARGMDYILDLAISDRSDDSREFVRRVELLRPLGAVEIVPTPYVTESTRVHLVLPVAAGDHDAVLAFLDSYARVCIDAGDNADLLVALMYPDVSIPGETDIYSVIKSTIAFYESRSKRGDARISWMSLRTKSTTGAHDVVVAPFTVLDTVLHRFSPEALIFICGIGMELSIELLNRVRMNTITGFQVFFPIGFWAYKPSLVYDQPPYPANVDITTKSGYYNVDRFDHASFYCADYRTARLQMTETSSSPTDIYELFIRHHPGVHILRAVEPALRIQYREESECPSKVSCPVPRIPANREQLAMLVFEHQQRLDRQQIDVMHRQHGENVDQMKPDMLR